MKRISIGILAAAIAGTAAAQGTLVYAPIKSIKEQDISVKGWGSGTISETDEAAYEGTHSLRIASRNYFQGGIIFFDKPVNLADDFADKSNLLKIVYKTVETGAVQGGPGGGAPGGFGPGGAGPGGAGPGGAGPGRGGPGGAGPGGAGPGGAGPGGAGPGGAPGQGAPGRGGPGAGTGATAAPSTLANMRVIVTTTDGKKSEAYVPLKTGAGGSAERGWSNVSLPLAAISGFDRTNKMIKSIAFAPDETATFYIGELRVVNDTTPIRGDISPKSLNLGAGQEVRLSARGFGGSSILKYTWDFDDADGIQVDADGQTVTRKFRKTGTYNVTLTISDHFGLKKPFTTTMKVVVN